jgi:serine/threonine protein kinase
VQTSRLAPDDAVDQDRGQSRDQDRGRDRDLSAQALTGRLADLAAGTARQVDADETWLYLMDPEMPALEHGWKLHLSAKADLLAETMDLVLPVLLRFTCDAKFAAGLETLRDLNAGSNNPASVGKAVTVYPLPRDLVPLATELARVLAGRPGPRVVSDRRLRADAPVYYRYGPFHVSAWTDNADLTIQGPAGQRFSGLAKAKYRQPEWIEDPFSTSAVTAPPISRIGEGRYRVTAGIVRSPRGNVYRAVEIASGRQVVIKQARAYVAEDTDGFDACGRLRHEHRVLRALAGVDGVPEAVDYFRHGEDEYLVSTSCGGEDLRRDIAANGPYHDPYREPRADPAGRSARGWPALARQLLQVLDRVHERGVVVRDFKPGNVVIDADGTARLVDFGISALDGQGPGGGTTGYSLPIAGPSDGPSHESSDGPSHEPPHGDAPADDYYALGATLFHAITMLDPITLDGDPATNRDRTLACLAGFLPDPRHPAHELIAGLLSPDADVRSAAADRLRTDAPDRRPAFGAKSGPGTRPGLPEITDGLLDDVIGHTLDYCARAAREWSADYRPRQPGRNDLDIYQGAAGVGLELLHHLDDQAETVAELASWAARHPMLPLLPPALYEGRAGVELFIAEARAALGDGSAGAGQPPPPTSPTSTDPAVPEAQADQISGAAGIGTGHLLLARRASADGRELDSSRHLAVAAQCARGILDGRFSTGLGENASDKTTPGLAALADGYAHGRAGIGAFLLGYACATGDAEATAAAERAFHELAAATPGLIAAAAVQGATRRYMCWCRGLTGVGSALLEAAAHYHDDALSALAGDCARAGDAIAARMGLVNQCCGLSGLGELHIDLAMATGDEQHRRSAERVAALILTRSAGTLQRPGFPDESLTRSSPGWAAGSAGVLTFMRRLRRRGGPRLWPAVHSGC